LNLAEHVGDQAESVAENHAAGSLRRCRRWGLLVESGAWREGGGGQDWSGALKQMRTGP
jgi:hypothetical protein